jgi:hypothetical protein
MRPCAIIILFLLCSRFVGAALAQTPAPNFSTGVIPDRVTVGDRFRAIVRVTAPAGSRVEFPALPERSDAMEPTDSVETLVAGAGEHVAIYRLVAWRTGEHTTQPLPVRVVSPDGEGRVYLVRLPLPQVLSVLPADTAGLEPRGPKEPIEPVRPLWPWIAAGAVLLAVVALLAAWPWRRRRARRAPTPAPAVSADPRGDALRALDEARAAGLVEVGEWKLFYSRVSGALRGYLATLSPEWGTDRTTAELVHRLRAAGIAAPVVEPLRTVLETADRVKFARFRPTAAEAEADWAAAREWVEGV